MENLLSKFLDAGLLPHLTSNESYEFVVSAIKEIDKSLTKNQANLVPFTLAALNPNVSQELPAVNETNEALRKFWKTISNNIPDAPRQIWRAIMWGALEQQTQETTAATIIWLTAGSLFQYLPLDNSERQVLEPFLCSLRDKTERQAAAEWQKPNNTDVPEALSLALGDLEDGTVDNDDFQEELIKACGPQGRHGTALKNANQQWPGNNTYQWSEGFAKIAAQAIGSRIDESHSSLATFLKTELATFAEEISQTMAQLTHTAYQTGVTERLREELLWWRQTLYSPLLKTSYRLLELPPATLLMACDVHQLLGRLHPTSVEYLLRETLRAAHGASVSRKTPLKVALQKMSISEAGKAVRSATEDYYENFLPAYPLFGILRNSVPHGNVATEAFRLIGLEPETEISYEDLAVWLFRDLQAHRLITDARQEANEDQ